MWQGRTAGHLTRDAGEIQMEAPTHDQFQDKLDDIRRTTLEALRQAEQDCNRYCRLLQEANDAQFREGRRADRLQKENKALRQRLGELQEKALPKPTDRSKQVEARNRQIREWIRKGFTWEAIGKKEKA